MPGIILAGNESVHKPGKEEAQEKIGRHLVNDMKYLLHNSKQCLNAISA